MHRWKGNDVQGKLELCSHSLVQYTATAAESGVLAPTHVHRERLSDADLGLGYTDVGGRFI